MLRTSGVMSMLLLDLNRLWVALMGVLVCTGPARCAEILLNEYNAVGSSKYLDEDFYSLSDKEDTYFATLPGLDDGRIQGNGGNWFEVVVVQDHLDVRGWELRWAETGSSETNNTDIWYGDPTVDQGILTFSQAPIWSDLRSGTIITFSELEAVGVDTDFDGADRNFTDNVAPGDVDVTIDLSSDTSFNPQADDWWIHVSTLEEASDASPLVTTVTNVQNDGPGNFSVGNDDWQLSIVNTADVTVFGPAGEDVTLGGGVSSNELFKLEGPVVPATVGDWEAITGTDEQYNDGTSSTFGSANLFSAGSMMQDLSPLRDQVDENVLGDMDCDGDVDFDDIDPFALGLIDPEAYENQFGVPPTTKGDLDENGRFDFDDIEGFVDILTGNSLAAGSSVSAPEPSGLVLCVVASLVAVPILRRRMRLRGV